MWTWDEYLEFSKKFPISFGENGEKHLYMMTGTSLLDFPSLQNIQVEMFTNYLKLYPKDIERFFTDYFPTFRQVLKSDALMPMELDESRFLREERTNDLLVVKSTEDNPIGMMQSFMAREGYLDTLALMRDPNWTFSGGPTEEEIVNEILPTLDSWMLLPVPVFDKDDVRYLGSMTACGIMKNAPHKELAAKFIEAMYSEEALDTGVLMGEAAFMGRQCPSQLIIDKYAYYPIFTDEDGEQVYTVEAGRSFECWPFTDTYAEHMYYEAQEYRSHLAVTRFHAQRDFYNAVWSYLQEWYLWKVMMGGSSWLMRTLNPRDADWKYITLLTLYLWKNIGAVNLLFLIGLQGIEPSVFDAASVDGASHRTIAIRIALPMLRTVTLFAIIYLAMNGMRIFRESYLLYGMYPPKPLYFIQDYVNNHFTKLDYGLLSAGSSLFALVMTGLFLCIWGFLQRKEDA